MKPSNLLANFPVLDTRQVDAAEHCLGQSLADVQINRVDQHGDFRLLMNAVNLERLSLLYNYFGADTRLAAGLDMDHVIFVAGLGVPLNLYIDDDRYTVTPKEAVLVTPSKRLQIERPANSEALVRQIMAWR